MNDQAITSEWGPAGRRSGVGVPGASVPMSVPICRDCRWCRYPGQHLSPCFHDAATRDCVNFITGASMSPIIQCAKMRGPSGPCGVEARLFEAKRRD